MDETEADQAEVEEERSPRYLLVIAMLMIFVAMAAYVFEEELFDVFYSPNLFVAGLIIPVVIALACLFAFSNLSLKGSSRNAVRRSQPKGGVTYNVFGGETVGDVKASHGRRKSARHLRKKLARNTPPRGPNSSKHEDDA